MAAIGAFTLLATLLYVRSLFAFVYCLLMGLVFLVVSLIAGRGARLLLGRLAVRVNLRPELAEARERHGSLVIDARTKPHHAPPLVEDPQVSRRVDALAGEFCRLWESSARTPG